MRVLGYFTCVAAMAAALAAAPASAVSTLDLRTDASAWTDGRGGQHELGSAVGGGGDVNGDGRRDVLLSGTEHDEGYAVYGPWSGFLDLAALPGHGFPFEGGVHVADAGDVNGDGIDDLLATSEGDPGGLNARAGRICVIFGARNSGGVGCDTLGARGFLIEGEESGDEAGRSVGAAGDVNGDGRDDVLIGAPFASPRGRFEAGRSYVVFGKPGTATVDLASLGAGGYQIDGEWERGYAGYSVAGAGDVNGDGRRDQLIGAPYASPRLRGQEGAAYVVYGKAATAPVDLAALGGGGYEISGAEQFDAAGWSVDRAGDVNGDGRPDQIVAALRGSGSAYVVFGRAGAGDIDLRSSTATYQIGEVVPLGADDLRVAGLGDVNGDGRADQVIGARDYSPPSRRDGGAAFVVYGKSSTSPIDLATYSGGFRIDGAHAGDRAGSDVAGPGNVSGSGKRDIVIGAPEATAGGRSQAGAAYVVAGGTATTRSIVGGAVVSPGRVRFATAAVSTARARATIRYRLRQTATVTVRLYRLRKGRRSISSTGAARCRAPAAELTRPAVRVPCVRPKPAGRVARGHRRAGTHRIHLPRRVGGKRLRAGRYVAAVGARDRRGRLHGPAIARFRVVGR